MKTIYLVRHGRTVANQHEIVQGAEEALSPEGEIQARRLAVRAAALSFDTLVASDYVRAQQTAALIAEATQHPVLNSELFREVARPSSLVGQSRIEAPFKNYLQSEWDNYSNPDWRYEDAENFSDVVTRVQRGLAFLDSLPGDSALVVSHGHFIRYFTAYIIMAGQLTPIDWSKMHLSFFMDNTGITVLEKNDIGASFVWKLKTWNDHAHFAE